MKLKAFLLHYVLFFVLYYAVYTNWPSGSYADSSASCWFTVCRKQSSMENEWKYVSSTGRWYYHGEKRKTLIAGGYAPCCWYAVYQKGEEIAYEEGFETINKAKEAAEAS